MLTGNQLISAVANELTRTDLDTTGAEVAVTQRALNDALRAIYNRHPWSWRSSATPLAVTLTAGTTRYDLSAGDAGKKIQDLYSVYLDTADLQSRQLDEWPLWRFRARWPNLAYLARTWPTHFTRTGLYTIELAPPPNSSTWTIKCYYSEDFTDLTDFTVALPSIPERVLEVLKLGMLARCYRWARDWDAADRLRRESESALGQCVKEDQQNPNLHFVMQPAIIGRRLITRDYWASPFDLQTPS